MGTVTSSQRFINQSIDEWRQRLRAAVNNKVAHTEQIITSLGLNVLQ